MSKRGLCLGGGGITGALYEVGCLAALEEQYADQDPERAELLLFDLA